MDDVTWAALTLTLAVVSAVGTWVAYRRRGLSAGLLGAAITLLFPAAYLTRTLRMVVRIGDAVADWALGLVFSPAVWAGVVLAGLSVVLFGASRVLARRDGAGTPASAPVTGASRAPLSAATPGPGTSPGRTKRQAATSKGDPAIDDDLAEIEALLRKRGIS